MTKQSILILLSCAFLLGCGSKKASRSLEIVGTVLGTGNAGLEAPRSEFKQNEKIWVTFDVNNITAMRTKTDEYFWIRQDVKIEDANGAVVLVKPSALDVKKPLTQKPVKFINEISLAGVQNLKSGTYAITLLVTDVIGFQTTKKRIPLKLL